MGLYLCSPVMQTWCWQRKIHFTVEDLGKGLVGFLDGLQHFRGTCYLTDQGRRDIDHLSPKLHVTSQQTNFKPTIHCGIVIKKTTIQTFDTMQTFKLHKDKCNRNLPKEADHINHSATHSCVWEKKAVITPT
jgi:hypothetical protein